MYSIYLYSSAQKVCAYLDKCKDFRSIKNEVYKSTQENSFGYIPCQNETHYQWGFVILTWGTIIKGGVAVGVVSSPTSAAQF